MPELPDVICYLEALERFLLKHKIKNIVIKSPFVLRTFEPPIEDCIGKRVVGFQRFGKRIIWELEGELNLVFHLMITGRFHWRKPSSLPRSKNDLMAILFEHGTMMLTEAGTKKRASLHVTYSDSLPAFDKSALEVMDCREEEFAQALRQENRTIKRALTNPNLLSGIGNAYSDEILLRAGISPFQHTRKLTDQQISRLFATSKLVLNEWIERLREQVGENFPERVTAFRDEMYAHGRFGKPCRVCKTLIQRVVYADKEMNYCPLCQTNGKILADRSLSRLLKDDWPKTVDDLVREEES